MVKRGISGHIQQNRLFSNDHYSLPFDWRWPKNCMKPQIFIGYNVPSSFGQQHHLQKFRNFGEITLEASSVTKQLSLYYGHPINFQGGQTFELDLKFKNWSLRKFSHADCYHRTKIGGLTASGSWVVSDLQHKVPTFACF